jgi:hypothetical protein
VANLAHFRPSRQATPDFTTIFRCNSCQVGFAPSRGQIDYCARCSPAFESPRPRFGPAALSERGAR